MAKLLLAAGSGHWIVAADLKPAIGYADLLTAESFRLSMTLDGMGVG
jgi:hypothetical protein